MRPFLLLAAALFGLATRTVQADDFDSDGVKIHYTVQGRGEPVILIHGLFASGPLNWTLPGITAALAEHAQVIVVDCRGHGLSGSPAGEHDYGIKMVEDVGRLMDHLGLKSAHLIGYSMGSMITLKFASLHPERVRSATLGGAGWMENGARFQRLAGGGNPGENRNHFKFVIAGFSDFIVPADVMKTLPVPIELITGDHDPARTVGVQPLLRLRPDLTDHVIADADHLSCVVKPQFKTEVVAALTRHLAQGEAAAK